MAGLSGFGFRDEVGEITVSGSDLDGTPMEGTKVYPFYTCGHCSKSIIMREQRARERKRCMACYRVICEKSPICNSQCTPLPALAKDHFQNPGPWGRYVPAIMAGVETTDEAEAKGLINLA